MFDKRLLFYDTLEIVCNFNCTLTCWKCNCASRYRTADEYYDFEALKKDLLYIFSLKDSEKIKKINLTGGDCLLYYKLKELIVFLRQFNRLIALLTNGILLPKYKDILAEDFNLKQKKNIIIVTDYNIKRVNEFIKNNKELNIFINADNGANKPWIDFEFRTKFYNRFNKHECCCKAINLYRSNVYYCYIARNVEKFVDEYVIKDAKQDLYSFNSVSSILTFLQSRSKICNCCYGSKSSWSLNHYEISDIIK